MKQVIAFIVIFAAFTTVALAEQATDKANIKSSTYGIGHEQTQTGSDKSIIVIGGKGGEQAGNTKSIIIVGSRVEKINGGTVTLRDESGKTMTIKVNLSGAKSKDNFEIDFGPSGSKGSLKAGDMVNIKNGVVYVVNK